MADTPNVITTTEDQLKSELAALAHRHVTLSWGILGALSLVLIVGVAGAWIAGHYANAQLARADAANAALLQNLKTFQDNMAAHDAERAAQDAQQKVIVQVVHDRDKAADIAIATALTPNAPAQAVATGLARVESDTPGFGDVRVTPDSNLAVTPAQGQILTAQKIDRDRLAGDLKDETNIFTLEKGKTFTLGQDLSSCKVELTESQKVIGDYKKAAKAGRFKKIVRGFGEGVAIAAAFWIGHKI